MEIFANTVTQYFAAICEGDVETWVNLFAENAVSHDPVGMPSYKGHEQLQKFFLGISKAFQKVSFAEENVYICGKDVAVKWNASGIGHNGVEVSFSGIDTFSMNDDGKIVELKAYWDLKATMAQLKG
ncbi:nuclear transport factor 2 family protein [Candidatus Uabimicrobium sp. HlEnr_7]|uniref:nuclear transport factor 2 family protein n=1 Tax=Candidatus Uabimicrobium helgolandensis TaxID=3095367 RepID=UPI003558D870